jgi:hypothetical protein
MGGGAVGGDAIALIDLSVALAILPLTRFAGRMYAGTSSSPRSLCGLVNCGGSSETDLAIIQQSSHGYSSKEAVMTAIGQNAGRDVHCRTMGREPEARAPRLFSSRSF